MNDQFLTKSKFSTMVEQVVLTHKISYMDAVIEICTTNNIDLEDVRKFIATSIKDKIEAEAMQLNFLPQANTLPVD